MIVGKIIEDSVSTPWTTPAILTLGAQASTFGSVLDLDLAEAWTAAKANASQGGIDLIFLFYGGSFHVDNAVSAKAAGIVHNINLTNAYDQSLIKDVLMVKVASRPADPESAKRVFAAGAKIRSSVITGGEIFLVESTEGRLAVLTVMNIVGTNSSGSVEVRLERSTLP